MKPRALLGLFCAVVEETDSQIALFAADILSLDAEAMAALPVVLARAGFVIDPAEDQVDIIARFVRERRVAMLDVVTHRALDRLVDESNARRARG